MLNKVFILQQFKAITTSFPSDKNSERTKVTNFVNLLKEGVFVAPEAIKYLTSDTTNLISRIYGTKKVALNSTFYKSFIEVDSLSELEHRVMQLVHYLTASESNAFIPNDDISEDDIKEIQKTFVRIELFTKKELTEKVKFLVYSEMPLSTNTVHDLYVLMIEEKMNIDVDKIKNKELSVRYSAESGIPSKNVDELMRAILFTYDNSTLLIQSKDKRNFIDYDRRKNFWSRELEIEINRKVYNLLKAYVDTFGEEALYKNIRRYKKTLLVIRKNFQNLDLKNGVKLINRLLRENKTKNIPKKHPLSLQITNTEFEFDNFNAYIKEANSYALIKYYNVIQENIMSLLTVDEDPIRLFKIRNGKVFIKVENNKNTKNLRKKIEILQDRLASIVYELKSRYEEKFSNKVIYLPESVMTLVMPTSGKSFVGELPEYSYVKVNDKFNIGIYWEGEPNAHYDLDLHGVSLSGRHIGWNGSLGASDSMTYTGDMTHTNKHGFAAEYIRIGKDAEGAVLSVSTFSIPNSDYEFKLIVAPYSKKELPIYNPNDILFSAKFKAEELSSKNITTVIPTEDGHLIAFTDAKLSTGRVPNLDITRQAISATRRRALSKITLEDFLSIVNANVVRSESELELEENLNKEVIDFSLDSLTQDKFTKLLDLEEEE